MNEIQIQPDGWIPTATGLLSDCKHLGGYIHSWTRSNKTIRCSTCYTVTYTKEVN